MKLLREPLVHFLLLGLGRFLLFGATKEKSDEFEWGYAITYADFGDGEISNGGARPISGTPWTVAGEYDTNRIIFAGLNFNWK